MLKQLIGIAIATLACILQLSVGSASALELDEKTRTVPLDAEGEQKTLSLQEAQRGKRLFNDVCAQCHFSGLTKTNPNVTLSQEDLAGAIPPRDNIEVIVDYLHEPTSYDGELDLSEYHPTVERPDLYPEMRNLTDKDLRDIAGHILIQPKVVGENWGGGKAYF